MSSRRPANLVRQSVLATAWIVAFGIGLLLLPSLVQANSDVEPSIFIEAPDEPFYNEPFDFTVAFNNTGTEPGYGPFVELELPASIDFTGATYFGVTVTPSLNQVCPGGGTFTNPLTGDTRDCTPGNLVLVLELPFGSFVPDQPAAVLDIGAMVTGSDSSVVGEPQTISAVGGFRYGDEATGNTPIYGDDTNFFTPTVDDEQIVTPTLVLLEKEYLGPEDETATGPNFPRVYRITADIADGQTLSNFQIIDQLPDNLAFLAVLDSEPGGATVIDPPAVGEIGATVTVEWPSVTGALGPDDAWVEIEFYAPLDDIEGDPVLDPVTGAFVITTNEATGSGTWTNGDNELHEASPAEHELSLQSIAIQKSVTVHDSAGDPVESVSPGRFLRWQLEVQVSDFFAFDNIVVDDVYGDGQSLVPDTDPAEWSGQFAPTLSWTSSDGSSGTDVPFTSDEATHTPDGTNGGGELEFDVSGLIGGTGRLIGGCVDAGGAGLLLPCDHDNLHDGPTTATIVFWTVIDENYVEAGAGPVVQGDAIDNDVDVIGDVLNINTFATSFEGREDDSAAGVEIETGTVEKSIYAVNGDTGGDPQFVQPGDQVTYRLQYNMPITRFEDFSLTDYLPLPVFLATEGGASSWDEHTGGGVPPAGEWALGPDHTFDSSHPIAVNVNSSENSIQFYFGDYASPPPHESSVIEILFTVTVQPDPFVDGLFLTNQVRAVEHNTAANPAPNDAIIQIQLAQPDLAIVKGVIDAPEHATLGTCNATPPVTDHTESRLNCDVSGLDAGDVITYAVTIANIGHYSAYSVHLADVLPAGIVGPDVLSITDGSGTSTGDTATVSGDEWEIVFADPIAPIADPATGDHIRIVTFTATVDDDIAAGGQTLTNTSTVLFANLPGLDPDDEDDAPFFHPPRSDDADATLLAPSVEKTLARTSEAHTTGNNVAIGEVVTYEVTVTVPEGVMDGAQIIDTLPTGLSFIEGTCTITAIDDELVFDPPLPADGDCIEVNNTPTFGFGTITNTATGGSETHSFTIEYDAVVENIGANQASVTRQNSARFAFEDGPDNILDTHTVTIVEPSLTVTKAFNPTEADAGDPVTITLTITNQPGPNAADAFDVTLQDVLHPDLVIGADPVTCSTDSGPDPAVECDWDSGTRTVSAEWGRLDVGDTLTVTIEATVIDGVPTGGEIPNDVDIQWTSLPGENGTDDATPGEPGSTTGKRTGSGDGPNNYDDDDNAVLEIFGFGPVKSLIATSEAHTEDEDVAIGEVARYRLVFRIAEGATPDVVITDHMASGLSLIGTPNVGFVSGNGEDLTSSIAGLENCGMTRAAFDGGASPTCDITPTGPVSNLPYMDYTFTLGDMTNDADDPEAELVVIEFDAVVLNVTGNVSGTTLPNFFDVTTSAGDVTQTSNTVTVTVQEPLVELTKSIISIPTNPDAGDVVTFQIQVQNTGTTTAFDVVIEDELPAELQLSGTPAVTHTHPDCTGGNAFTSTDQSAGNTLQIDLSCLNTGAPGPVVTIEYTATIVSTVAAGSLIENVAEITYTSVPGPQGTDDATPGDPGDEDGKRIYERDDAESFTTANPSIEKLGPEPDTATIGEQVTYDIVVTLPEGTTHNLVVEELLPTVSGNVVMSFIDAELVTTGYNGTTDGITTGVVGDVVTINLGSPVTAADNDPDNNSFVVRVTLQVLNVAVNQDGEQRVNRATGSWTPGGPNEDPESFPETSADPLTIVEPQLEISKDHQFLLPSPVEAGQEVEYTVVVEHRDDSTSDAHDVTVTDALPPELALTSTVTVATAPDGCATGVDTSASTGQLVTVTIELLPQDCVVTITYVATIQNIVTPGILVMNAASVDWASVPDSTGEEDSGRTGGGDPEHNDYDDATETIFATTGRIAISKNIAGSNNPDTTPNSGSTADVAIGEVVTYELTVTMMEGTTEGVIVIDELPAGLQYVDGSLLVDDSGFGGTIPVTDWTCNPCAGTTLQVEFAPIVNPSDLDPNNDSFIIRFDAVVLNDVANTAGPPPTVLPNTATVQRDVGEEEDPEEGGPFESNEVELTVVEPEFAITKTFINPDNPTQSPVEAYANQEIEVRLEVENTGTGPAYEVEVSDPLPEWLINPELVSVTPGSSGFTFSYDVGTHTVFFTDGFLDAGGSATLIFRVTLRDDTPASTPWDDAWLVNVASVEGTSMPGTPPEERTYEPVSDDDNLIVTAPDVWVTKVDDVEDGEAIQPGETLIYTIEYGNAGNELAPNVVLTETVPAHTTFSATFSSASWTCADGGVAGSTCTLAVGDLAPDAGGTVFFAVHVDETVPALAEQIENTVIIADDGSRGADRDPSDNEDEEITPLDAAPILQVTKGDGGIIAWPSGDIVYTIVYGNIGNQDATGVTLTETVPDNTTFLPGATGNADWSCTNVTAGSTCTLAIGDLAAGDSGSVTFTVRVDDGPPGPMDPIENLVQIADDGTNTDGEPVTDEDDEETPVRLVDLAVTKSVVPSTVVVGSAVTFTIVVTNLGPSDATGVVVEDVLPPGLAYVSHTADGVYAPPTWTIGDIPAGSSRTLVIVAQATTVGTHVNTARIIGVNEHDPNPANDQDDAVVTVTDPPTPTPTPTPTASPMPSPTVTPTATPPSIVPPGPGPGPGMGPGTGPGTGPGASPPPPASTGMGFVFGTELAVSTVPMVLALFVLLVGWLMRRWRHYGATDW